MGSTVTSSGSRPTNIGVKSAASGVVADTKKRLSAISGSPSSASKIAARSGHGLTATAKNTEALQARINELEAENNTLKGERSINGHADLLGEEIEAKNREIEELKAKIKENEELVRLRFI